jgi:hypothetical protein
MRCTKKNAVTNCVIVEQKRFIPVNFEGLNYPIYNTINRFVQNKVRPTNPLDMESILKQRFVP